MHEIQKIFAEGSDIILAADRLSHASNSIVQPNNREFTIDTFLKQVSYVQLNFTVLQYFITVWKTFTLVYFAERPFI